MANGIVKYPLKNDEPNTFDAGPDEGGLSAPKPKPASDLKNNALRVVAVSSRAYFLLSLTSVTNRAEW